MPCIFIARRFQLFSRTLASNGAYPRYRRSQQLILFYCAKYINSKSHHGGIQKSMTDTSSIRGQPPDHRGDRRSSALQQFKERTSIKIDLFFCTVALVHITGGGMLYVIYVVIRTRDGPRNHCIPLCLHTIFGSDYYSYAPHYFNGRSQ